MREQVVKYWIDEQMEASVTDDEGVSFLNRRGNAVWLRVLSNYNAYRCQLKPFMLILLIEFSDCASIVWKVKEAI